VIGESRAIQAFMQARTLRRGALEVELRPLPPTTDPRSDVLMRVPPLVVLWVDERPVAVRIRSVVALSRSSLMPRLSAHLEAEALAAGLAVERVGEARLWRLFAGPPRPRLTL
jgi:hypothetical protein